MNELLDKMVQARQLSGGDAATLLQASANGSPAVQTEEDVLRWGWIAPAASHVAWDSAGSTAIFERQARIARDAGALAELPVYLSALALDRVWNGDLSAARLLIAEGDSIAGVYRQRVSLASGRFAMVDDGLGFSLVPWTPSLERRLGQQVSGVVRSGGSIAWGFGRKQGLAL